MSEYDPFEGSSGLTNDVDVSFTSCRFIKDPGYVDTESGEMIPVFAVDFHTDSGEVIENQFFSIGKGWEITDGGAKVVRVEGTKGFNNSSYLQIFLGKLLELNEDAVRGRYEATGLAPQEAGYWEGLSVHVEQTEYQAGGFRKPKDQWIMRTRLMPTAVHGWDGADVPAKKEKPAPAKKAAAKKVAARKPAKQEAEMSPYEAALADVDPDIMAAIRAIAAEVDTAEEFIDRCYAEVDGLDEDANAMLLVDDVDSDGTIWVKAVNAG